LPYYKQSFYNHLIAHENGQWFLFNTNSLALALLSSEQKETIQNIFATLGQQALDNTTSNTLLSSLINNGYLIPVENDEKIVISDRQRQARQEKNVLNFTLAPTLGCNFNCPYCFEAESIRADFKVMSEDTQQHIVNYARSYIQANQSKFLRVTWFGGEPLLAMSTIVNLTRYFFTYANQYKLHYASNIVTNGYKLTPTNIELLRICKIFNVQITIDGPEHIHNERRVAKNGKETYKILIRNIKNALASNLVINIRINVDEQNIDQIHILLTDLDKHDITNKVSITLGYITSDYKTQATEIDKLTRNKFAQLELLVKTQSNHINAKHTLPKIVKNYCAADSDHSLMVGPMGELYQCWDDFGDPQKVVGNIRSTIRLNKDYVESYTAFDPTIHPKCSQCNVLPLCMGGCPKQRLLHGGVPQCGSYKYNLSDWVKTYAKQKDEACYNPL